MVPSQKFLGPRCQLKADTLAYAGHRPAYMLVNVTDGTNKTNGMDGTYGMNETDKKDGTNETDEMDVSDETDGMDVTNGTDE